MTAFDLYYEALVASNLPATVPVVQEGETIGLGTSVFNLMAPDVRNLALSTDPQQRGVAAVYACRTAHKAIEDSRTVS